jgi:hypothetical protein
LVLIHRLALSFGLDGCNNFLYLHLLHAPLDLKAFRRLVLEVVIPLEILMVLRV